MTTQPSWLSLTPYEQQAALLRLLETAPRSKGEQANKMLCAPPLPTDQTDAEARASTVIRYLAGGYRVGDLLPSALELR